MKKRIIIVGAGNAGLRFANIAHKNHMDVGIYMHHGQVSIPEYCTSEVSLASCSTYDAAIIASPPSTHMKYVSYFVDRHIPVLIEKPFSDSMKDVLSVIRKANRTKTVIRSGFNLRFLPVIQTIHSWLMKKRLGTILAADFSVGQYLLFWRPGKDYRTFYSAQYALGGGVALDLIHEIDIALQFFPGMHFLPIISSKLSSLDISAEDFVVFQNTRKPYCMVSMNYLSHIYTRRYRIIGSKGSIECDVVNKRLLFVSGDGRKEEINDPTQFDISKTYEMEFSAFMKDIDHDFRPIDQRGLGIDALQAALKGRRHIEHS